MRPCRRCFVPQAQQRVTAAPSYTPVIHAGPGTGRLLARSLTATAAIDETRLVSYSKLSRRHLERNRDCNTGLAVVFPVQGIADIMAFVLDSPVAADTLVHSGSCHFPYFPAGEDEGVSLADPVAGDLEYLAADAGGLGCMREIDAVGASEPAGPFLYPSPAVFLHDVMRSSGEQRENLVEYLPL